MAIIEEPSSDEEQHVQPHKPPRPADSSARSDLGVASSSNPVQALLASKKALNEDTVSRLLDGEGPLEIWQHILAGATDLLKEKGCDSLDITQLERLTSIVALFARHAVSAELSKASESFQTGIKGLLNIVFDILKIPSVFLKDYYAINAQKQSFWLAGSTCVLQLLQAFFKLDCLPISICNELDREANAVIALSKFTTTGLSTGASCAQDLDSWITPLSNKLAAEMLTNLSSTGNERQTGTNATEHRLRLVKHVLLTYIKPLFITTPHPMLNPDTARKLDRKRGGDLFGDSYMDGDWKGRSVDAEETGAVGCWKTYLYFLTMIDKDHFEDVWPLLVPPLMTLLDDHQTYFKHQGIIALSAFLARTPAILLQRTGLNDLMQQSLTNAFSFTSEAENVPMIRDAILTNLQLVNLMYPRSTSNVPGSVSASTSHHRKKQVDSPALIRFNTLSSIYQSCIISIFTYASSSIPFMTLAFTTIPLLVDELIKGSIRFLQDTMIVLCSSLGGSVASKALSSIFTEDTVKMHIAASEAIVAFIKVCKDAGRIERWRGMILSSVATLWCNIREQKTSISTVQLQESLINVIHALTNVCGDVAMDCERIRAMDPELFSELL